MEFEWNSLFAFRHSLGPPDSDVPQLIFLKYHFFCWHLCSKIVIGSLRSSLSVLSWHSRLSPIWLQSAFLTTGLSHTLLSIQPHRFTYFLCTFSPSCLCSSCSLLESLFHETHPTLNSPQVPTSKILWSSSDSECVIIIIAFIDHLLCVRPLFPFSHHPHDDIYKADTKTLTWKVRKLTAESQSTSISWALTLCQTILVIQWWTKRCGPCPHGASIPVRRTDGKAINTQISFNALIIINCNKFQEGKELGSMRIVGRGRGGAVWI